ncbi:MAG: tyrosine-type recombinase/integrase [Roseibium sp.]|uniref:tyrosine-type recombinase/integrase n=1 Tax=Roseibium sp. TaxID=1936156 RepID=UPI001B1E29EF|nr:tyrosine-type recombinase/integrase [Roseibium sp.]MBO6892290.1 tyrosine-type recombinase/integrase [Roseibium sp.]MBO6929885.1 tyrosine-type recombinase/integrase [Roseibium sp.]
MPLEIYKRGNRFWVRGRTDGIDGYIERSLKTSDGQVAAAKVGEIERKARQRAVLGQDAPTEADELTFAAAVVLYNAKPADAGYLLKVMPEIGTKRVKEITPKFVRNLGKKLYPNAACDTWRRQVVTPICAVINNAHQEKGTPPIKVKGYTPAERQAQDDKRGKQSRVPKTPGSWEWLDKFRDEANVYMGALALFMFTTGARIGQSVLIKPSDLDLQNGRLWLPPSKGHPGQWVDLIPEVIVALANLKPRKGRVFGYTSRSSAYGPWRNACNRAGIEYLAPHAAGRHGFGTETVVRQGVNPVDAAKAGRWSSPRILLDTYAHSEESSANVRDAFTRNRNPASAKPRQLKSVK